MAALENGPTVHFGATGYQDFTSHGDEDRKAAYLLRHESRENWTLKGVDSAGFWARWLRGTNTRSEPRPQTFDEDFPVCLL